MQWESTPILGTLIDNLIHIAKGIFCNVGDYGEEGTPDPIPNTNEVRERGALF